MSCRASRSRRIGTTTFGAAAASLLSPSSLWIEGFTATTINDRYPARGRVRPLCIYAPPGSGYVCSSDAISDEGDPDDSPVSHHPELTPSDLAQISPPAFPSTYEPMLEYPGTMRPGRTPENMPYHDLPNIGIDDPDPVPWPHFQEIEWHHRWDPPHAQALAMEEFIEVQGRWASVEEEAEMRMGMRRGVRERREMEELAGKGGGGSSTSSGVSGASGAQQMVIMDDEEEEEGGRDNGDRSNIGIGLGEGVEALLKNAADNAARSSGTKDDESHEDDYDDGSDDFLLDLGLGGDDEVDEGPSKKTLKMEAAVSREVGEEDDNDDTEDDLDLDFELGLDLGDEEDDNADDDENGDFDNYDDDEEDISLDDYTKEDDGGDDDEFDDGGFDYGN